MTWAFEALRMMRTGWANSTGPRGVISRTEAGYVGNSGLFARRIPKRLQHRSGPYMALTFPMSGVYSLALMGNEAAYERTLSRRTRSDREVRREPGIGCSRAEGGARRFFSTG